MPRPITRRVALRAAQFAIGAAGILFLLFLFSRQADAATTDQSPPGNGLTSAVSAVTSAASSSVTSVAAPVTSAVSGAASAAATTASSAAKATPPAQPAAAARSVVQKAT